MKSGMANYQIMYWNFLSQSKCSSTRTSRIVWNDSSFILRKSNEQYTIVGSSLTNVKNWELLQIECNCLKTI